jgi:protein TonB
MKALDLPQLDETPVPKFQARPQYPLMMLLAGIAGEVVVDFIVDANGVVVNAFAFRSRAWFSKNQPPNPADEQTAAVIRSSQREFEAAAIAAVSQWKFQPGRKDGRDVPTHMQVPIIFNLDN